MDKLVEKQVEKILVDETKKLGGRAYKWTSPGNDGVPDRIVFLPGGIVEFCELKTESGRVSDLQRKQIRFIRDNGNDVSVIYGVKGVADFFSYNGFMKVHDKIEKKYGKEEWYRKGKYVFRGQTID